MYSDLEIVGAVKHLDNAVSASVVSFRSFPAIADEGLHGDSIKSQRTEATPEVKY